jgi:hypothetical protein
MNDFPIDVIDENCFSFLHLMGSIANVALIETTLQISGGSSSLLQSGTLLLCGGLDFLSLR